MLKIILFAIVVILTQPVWGQEEEKIYKNEFRFVIDNDVFTSLYRDQYYTSGLFLYYRHLAKNPVDFRLIWSYGLLQRIYTPHKLSWDDPDEFDRPYAGQLAVTAGAEWYFKTHFYVKSNVELGIMGPSTKSGEIQTAWHELFGINTPMGWEYQIGNGPILNYYGTFANTWVKTATLQITPETHLALGSAFSYIRQEVTLRLGKLKNISESVMFNGSLGSQANSTDKTIREIYLFYAPGIEYNLHNSTIEGNVLGDPSPHTEIPENWVWQHRVGLTMSWDAFDVHIAYYYRTNETMEALAHQYVGIHLNGRF